MSRHDHGQTVAARNQLDTGLLACTYTFHRSPVRLTTEDGRLREMIASRSHDPGRETGARFAALLATLAIGAACAPASASASPICNARAAAQLEKRLPVTPYNAGRRIGQTLCFDMTGDGRKDIVFSGWQFMNHGAHYWAAFRATRSNWVRMKFKRGCCRADPRFGSGIQIRRSGRDVVVHEPVYATSDPACCPSGGTKTGIWRWRNPHLILVDVLREP